MAANKLPKGDDLTARILSFMAADDRRLARFLDATGLDPANIRDVIGTRGFADALVEHVLEDDFSVLAFAAYCEVPIEEVHKMRRPIRLVPTTRQVRALRSIRRD